jgi:ATP-binding cassette subfamily B multidrug efflux pump
MWRVMQIGLETPWQVTIALLSTLLAAIFQLMIPQLLGRAVDLTQGVATGDRAAQDALLLTALAVLGVAILRGVFATFQNYFSEAVGHHTGYRLRLSYYDRIQHLSFGFHDSVHSGDLITLGLLDIEGARMFFATGIIRFLLLFVLIGFGGWWLLSIDLWLGLLALSFVPYVGWRSSQSQLELRQTWLDLQERLSVLSRVMEENLAGTRIVRAFSAHDHEMQKFREASVRALDLAHERVDLRVNSTAAMTLSFLLAMGAVLLVGGIKVRTGEMTVGTLTAFLTFMTILQMPVRQLGMLVNSIARTSTCGARVFGLLDLEPSVADVPGVRDLRIDGPVLRFEDVGFAYPSARDTPVLRNLSFTARRGEIIGIIGPPGSGKTTVAQLIPRFYDVTSGAITIDGQDREQHRLWRSLGRRGRHRRVKRRCAASCLCRHSARTLPHGRRRTRRVLVRRAAAADVHCTHAAGGTGNPCVRRFHRRDRRQHRAAYSCCDPRLARPADHHPCGASAQHAGRCRSHPCAGTGPHRGAGQSCRTHGAWGPLP